MLWIFKNGEQDSLLGVSDEKGGRKLVPVVTIIVINYAEDSPFCKPKDCFPG